MLIIRTDMPEGNANSILGIVSDMLLEIYGDTMECKSKIEEYYKKATSGDYENLKKVSKEFVPGMIEFASSDEIKMHLVIYEGRKISAEDIEEEFG